MHPIEINKYLMAKYPNATHGQLAKAIAQACQAPTDIEVLKALDMAYKLALENDWSEDKISSELQLKFEALSRDECDEIAKRVLREVCVEKTKNKAKIKRLELALAMVDSLHDLANPSCNTPEEAEKARIIWDAVKEVLSKRDCNYASILSAKSGLEALIEG